VIDDTSSFEQWKPCLYGLTQFCFMITVPTYMPTYFPTTSSSKANKNKNTGGKSDKIPMLRSDPYSGKARKLRLLAGKDRRTDQ
jgi:hypothetical protein